MPEFDELFFRQQFSDKLWRLSNLYYIKDKSGNKVLFKPNWAQLEMLKPHYLNIVLKARQLGVTTLHSLLFLDCCLFNENVNAAIIADNKPNSREIFIDKVKFAYDNLPDWIKTAIPAHKDNVNELRFKNGSVYRVGTSLRSGTLQLLHITEFAKICVDNPKKAKEIVSGALNTIQAGQFCCIESTARGREGAFYDMCKRAMAMSDSAASHSPLDWKFWFFPWWKHPEYSMPSPGVLVTKEHADYFSSLEHKHRIFLNAEQKAWYIKKLETQNENMMREYPSTPDEAFMSANEGFYFGHQMAKTRMEHRICHVPHEDNALTYTAWDIGIGDPCAIFVFQTIGKEIRFLEYYENSDEPLAHYVNWLKKLPYTIDKHFMPHDAANRSAATGKSYADIARELGFKVEIIPIDKNEQFGIENVRNMFPRFWFDQSRCSKGIKSVESFRKEWNDKLGCYRERSLHDWASHGAKALIYACRGVERTQNAQGLSAEEWRKLRYASIA